VRLRQALAEPDVWFIVTPVEAEAHFVRDYDGVVEDAGEVGRRRVRVQREFGVDMCSRPFFYPGAVFA
jgi:hypothetical protein